MSRFNAAKIFDAIDKKFQQVYNQLIDLLDTGYSITAMINGEKIDIDINPKVGMQISLDGKVLGGVTVVDGEIRMVAEVLASQYDTRGYIKVGDDPTTAAPNAMYGYYKLTGEDHYNKRFTIVYTDTGIVLSSINDDNANSDLQIFANGSYGGASIGSPSLLIHSHSDAGWGADTSYIGLSDNGVGLFVKGSIIYAIDISDDTIAIPVYANNAAALAGGLLVGGFYRTGGDPDALCIVH